MSNFKWEGDHIVTTPPKKPKKMTGTRFASVLGLNKWSTPFEMWCEITKTYQKPFEDTIYTIAGKTIEPKQAQYMKEAYFMRNLVKPEDIWGKDYFKKTYGDFFPEEKVYGGMWDYLLYGRDGKPTTVLEMKTSKRVEDWEEDIPEYYALQAALYAWLLGVDDVIMVASFLEDSDYENPDAFVPDASNTIIRPFKVSERYPDFRNYVMTAMQWWQKYVETGISPPFDEKRDAEILKELRKTNVDFEAEQKDDLLAEAEALKSEIDAHYTEIAEKEKRLKVLTDAFKADCMSSMADPGIKQAVISGSRYTWTLTRQAGGMGLDEEAMKADGIWEKYAVPKADRFVMKVSANK